MWAQVDLGLEGRLLPPFRSPLGTSTPSGLPCLWTSLEVLTTSLSFQSSSPSVVLVRSRASNSHVQTESAITDFVLWADPFRKYPELYLQKVGEDRPLFWDHSFLGG